MHCGSNQPEFKTGMSPRSALLSEIAVMERALSVSHRENEALKDDISRLEEKLERINSAQTAFRMEVKEENFEIANNIERDSLRRELKEVTEQAKDAVAKFGEKRRQIIDIEAKRSANENHLYLLKDMLNQAYARGKALHEEKIRKTEAIMVNHHDVRQRRSVSIY